MIGDDGSYIPRRHRHEGVRMRTTHGRVFPAAVATLVSLAAPGPSPLAAQDMAAPIAAPAAAPGVCRLTLEEAQRRALTNSKALNLARLNVGAARHAADAARKDYFPKIL